MCSRLSVLCPLCHGHNALPNGFLSSHFYRTDNGKKQSHSWLPPLSAFPKRKNWKQLHSSPASPADKVCVAYAIYSQPSPPSPQMEQAKFAELPCFQLEQPNICCCCHLWQREGTAAGILKGPIVPTGAWVGWVGGRQPRSQRVSNSGCGIDIGVRALQVRMHKPGLSKQAGMLLQARRMADTNQKEVAQEFHLPCRPCSRQSGAGHSSAYLALVLHDLVLLTLAAFSLAPLRFIFS